MRTPEMRKMSENFGNIFWEIITTTELFWGEGRTREGVSINKESQANSGSWGWGCRDGLGWKKNALKPRSIMFHNVYYLPFSDVKTLGFCQTAIFCLPNIGTSTSCWGVGSVIGSIAVGAGRFETLRTPGRSSPVSVCQSAKKRVRACDKSRNSEGTLALSINSSRRAM